MEATALYTGIVLLLTFLLVSLRSVWGKGSHPRFPPAGPLPLPIIGHLHLIRLPLHQTLARISARHGPLLLLRFGARPVLLVSSPALAEECYTKNDIVFANRPVVDSGRYLTYNYTTLGSAPYGSYWRNLRRITSNEIFSTARVAALAPVRAVEVHSLLQHLFRSPAAAENCGAAAGFRTVELKSRLAEVTFNLIMQMVAGKRYYGESATADVAEGGRFRRVVKEVFRLGGLSNAEDFIPMMKWLGINKLKKELVRVKEEMDELFQDMVEERRRWRRERPEAAGADEKKMVLDVMLTLQESDPVSYTDEVIKGVILVLLTAGTDTSSSTMEWAMCLLLNHPAALQKVKDEIEAQAGCGDRLLADSDLPNLPYLHNVIKETLRLFPQGPLLVPHQSSGHCTVGGYDVPAGTMLLINAYAMNRDPAIWREALKFKPERFEAGEGEAEGYKYIPFGSGRRRCPGDGMAMRMMALTLGSLIQCFEWKRAGEEEVDLAEGTALTLPKAVPLQALYRPREGMIKILSGL